MNGHTQQFLHKKKNHLALSCFKTVYNWLRGPDLNQRPSGYEPDELPTALPRVIKLDKCTTLNRKTQMDLLG